MDLSRAEGADRRVPGQALSSAGLLLGALLACGPSRPARPNVVLITLDTTRADHLHTWGYDRDTSDTLDALAAESIVFDDLMVPIATTLPSHTSLLTGTEPLEHGILANIRHGGQTFVASPALRTWPDLLHEHGYATAAFLSATPLAAGSGIEAGFDEYDCPSRGSRIAEHTTAKALRWLKDRSGPYLLWVHYYDPHGPFEPPKRHARAYKRDGMVQDWLNERRIGAESVRPTGQVVDSVDDTNLYDGEIRYMDRQIGRLLDRLREDPAWDHTVVVVVGDHGEGLGQHGMAGHGGIWREQLHAPLIVRTPWDAPRRVSRPIGMTDVLPTVLALGNFPATDVFLGQVSGRDALGTPERLLYHHTSARQLEFGRSEDAVSVSGWRLIRDLTGSDRLFSLPDDPYELRDVAGLLPVHVGLLAAWGDEAQRALVARGEALGRAAPRQLSGDEVDSLRALGYVEGPAEEAGGDLPSQADDAE